MKESRKHQIRKAHRARDAEDDSPIFVPWKTPLSTTVVEWAGLVPSAESAPDGCSQNPPQSETAFQKGPPDAPRF